MLLYVGYVFCHRVSVGRKSKLPWKWEETTPTGIWELKNDVLIRKCIKLQNRAWRYNCYYVLCISVFYLHGCLCTTYVPQSFKEGNWCLGTRVTNHYGLLCGFWELNTGSMQEQPILLYAESSLQSWELSTFRDILTGYRSLSLNLPINSSLPIVQGCSKDFTFGHL